MVKRLMQVVSLLRKLEDIMNIIQKQILLVLIFFAMASNLFGQSKYSKGIFLKSIQVDFTSLILINGASLYNDIDFFKKKSGSATYGLRMGLDLVDIRSITEGDVEGYPVRNLSASIRASSKPSKSQVNGLLSFVNTRSMNSSFERKDGNNLRLEIEAIKYFTSERVGLKIKLQLPVFNFQGERTGGYIGLGFVLGYLSA